MNGEYKHLSYAAKLQRYNSRTKLGKIIQRKPKLEDSPEFKEEIRQLEIKVIQASRELDDINRKNEAIGEQTIALDNIIEANNITVSKQSNQVDKQIEILGQKTTIVVSEIDLEKQLKDELNASTRHNKKLATAKGRTIKAYQANEVSKFNIADKFLDMLKTAYASTIIHKDYKEQKSQIVHDTKKVNRNLALTLWYGTIRKVKHFRINPTIKDNFVLLEVAKQYLGIPPATETAAIDTSSVTMQQIREAKNNLANEYLSERRRVLDSNYKCAMIEMGNKYLN